MARANKVRGKGLRGCGGEATRKIFGATPFTLAQNASPNIMLTISDEETFIILWQLSHKLEREENFLTKNPLIWRRMHPLIPHLPVLKWKV